jgi:16S rRNA (guanine966-N2)-methyltransferase
VTRIVAGTAGGRRLLVPRGSTTRPTSERVREALFSGLEARGVVLGARVLDLYAGSGALGLEAASRGAADVVLVESARHAAEVARENVSALGMPRASVVLSSVERYLQRCTGWSADLVLIDPPYGQSEDEVARVLELLTRGWLAADAFVVVERSGRGLEPRWPAALERLTVRHYGDTALWTATATAVSR